jgi:NADPH:quinone reductase-like Zn-dependent oxidoreductase
LGDVLENVVLDREPDLAVGPDEVLARIEAATINPVDAMLGLGNYDHRIEVPFTLGPEGVGRATRCSSRCSASTR